MFRTDFEKIFAELTLCQYNLKVLHWKSVGKDFDAIHGTTEMLYFDIGNILDSIAETMISMGYDPLSLCDCHKVLDEDTANTYISIDPKYNYDSTQVYAYLNDMFESLIKNFVDLQSKDIPSDVKSLIDEKLLYLRKEHQYKGMMRRLK